MWKVNANEVFPFQYDVYFLSASIIIKGKVLFSQVSAPASLNEYQQNDFEIKEYT